MEKTKIPTERSDGRSCGQCRSFGVMNGTSTICRKHPPVVHVAQFPIPTGPGSVEIRTNCVTAWPGVQEHEWCLEYERRSDG